MPRAKRHIHRGVGRVERAARKRVKVSQGFITALSIVSILGFVGIVSSTILDKNITFYIEGLWMIVIGLGLLIESRIRELGALARDRGLTSDNFARLTTLIIGAIAIMAGIFSLPPLRVENPAFLAIKGIVGIVAITIIIIQTWIVD